MEGHQITDIDLIDNDKLLFTIENNNEVYAIIYNIRSKEITTINKDQ